MAGIQNLPEWLGAAVIGAVIAALGYVGRLVLEGFGQVMERRRRRTAALVGLQSLLRAGRAAFLVQVSHRDRLAELLARRDSELSPGDRGYERLFVEAYPSMTPPELELHGLIRSITVNALRPLNDMVLAWVRSDDYFKSGRGRGLGSEVARDLGTLEAHLILWNAKYDAWIATDPAHALIYLADEEHHGVGWPRGIEDRVDRLLSKRVRFWG